MLCILIHTNILSKWVTRVFMDKWLREIGYESEHVLLWWFLLVGTKDTPDVWSCKLMENKDPRFSCWRRQWHPTPVFLPGKSHGLRSTVVYRPWGCKASDMTERLHSLRKRGTGALKILRQREQHVQWPWGEGGFWGSAGWSVSLEWHEWGGGGWGSLRSNQRLVVRFSRALLVTMRRLVFTLTPRGPGSIGRFEQKSDMIGWRF